MTELINEPGTTYDDWLLLPGRIRKGVKPENVDLRTPITRYSSDKEMTPGEIPSAFVINIPLLSAPMQSVTGPEMAIELAKQGGLGVIYCSQPVGDEADMVRKVKRHKSAFVEADVVSPEMPITNLADLIRKKGYDTFPVTEGGKPNGRLVGLITGNDFSEREHGSLAVRDRMIPFEMLAYDFYENVYDNLREANRRLVESHHGSIPIIDKDGNLRYMVFRKDIEEHRENPLALVDGKKRYRVGAAINTHDYKDRVPALAEAGADILFIDASQGFSDYQEEALKYMAENYPGVPVIGGNIVEEDGFDLLVKSGASGVKVGMGPGSICTTREKFRIGRAQATAVRKVAEKRDRYLKEKGVYVPIIADGGVVTNDHIWIALALGADAVMAGRFFARFHESPTKVQELKEEIQGRVYTSLSKPYWGEGSERGRAWLQQRYGQFAETEGVEGFVPYAGHLRENLPITLENIRIALSKNGYRNILDLHANAVLEKESESSKNEGRPHDIFRGDKTYPYSS